MASKHEHNALTRHTQLDEATAAALDAWQQRHGVRSASAAVRQLLQRALAADGALDPEERVRVARVAALRAARVAVLDALDGLDPDRAETVTERLQHRAKPKP